MKLHSIAAVLTVLAACTEEVPPPPVMPLVADPVCTLQPNTEKVVLRQAAGAQSPSRFGLLLQQGDTGVCSIARFILSADSDPSLRLTLNTISTRAGPGEAFSAAIYAEPVIDGARGEAQVWVDSKAEPILRVPIETQTIVVDVTFDPPRLELDAGTILCVNRRTVTVRPVNPDGLRIDAVSINGRDAANFAFVGPSLPIELRGDQSVELEVEFVPITVGPMIATLSVSTATHGVAWSSSLDLTAIGVERQEQTDPFRATGDSTPLVLRHTPVSDSINVRVNGDYLPSVDWTYDEAANAIVFVPAAIPAAGAAIEVEYTVRCLRN